MVLNYEIDNYAIKVWSSRSVPPAAGAAAGIFLYANGVERGYAYFYPDGQPLDPPVVDEVNGFVAANYSLSQFAAVHQLMLQERPIYLYGTDQEVCLMTQLEPPGEEEGLSG
jgi:hypothetical protein